MESEAVQPQIFTVIINWSPESEARVTEGDIREVVEQLVLEIDEEATVEIEENITHGL
ncbi:MAG: hypothetical protein N3B12_09135 [Armatimonadetes bacterium]|nr:hypothetical protein [Armatimonadota bacterium]